MREVPARLAYRRGMWTRRTKWVASWVVVCGLGAVALVIAHQPTLIILVALICVAVVVGAWQWQTKVTRVPGDSFRSWLRDGRQ